MDNSIILSPVPISDLISQLREVIKEEIAAGQNAQMLEKLLSPAETCKLFVPAITRPTLEKLVKAQRLNKCHLNSRVYFKYSDVIEALKTYKRYEQQS